MNQSNLIKYDVRTFLSFFMVSSIGLWSCVTPQQKKEMDEDIFRLQTRVLQLESNLNSGRTADQKAGEAHHKTLASTSSDVERMSIEMKRIKGDIDALKIGVQTGQMPGQEAAQEGSVSAQMAEIRVRVEAIETQQREIITALERESSGSKKSGDKKDSSAGSANADTDSLKNAFDRKHFREVAEDAPSVLKKTKGKDREQVLMIYGESLMRLNRPKEAALQFNELVELRPGDKLMAVAKLRLGDAFKSMGEKDTSKLFYEEVATKYVGTPEADKAKKALKSKK